MYMGTHGVYTHTFEYGRKPDCPVCSQTSQRLRVARACSVSGLIELLKGEGSSLRLKAPSLTRPGVSIYMQTPPLLEQATRPNLARPLAEFVADGEEITVTDPVFPGDVSLSLVVTFADDAAAPPDAAAG